MTTKTFRTTILSRCYSPTCIACPRKGDTSFLFRMRRRTSLRKRVVVYIQAVVKHICHHIVRNSSVVCIVIVDKMSTQLLYPLRHPLQLLQLTGGNVTPMSQERWTRRVLASFQNSRHHVTVDQDFYVNTTQTQGLGWSLTTNPEFRLSLRFQSMTLFQWPSTVPND